MRPEQKWKQLIYYLFFGVCTTLCNVIFYGIFTRVADWGILSATWGAWFLAVLFAFITNKKFVFESRSLYWKILGREAAAFFCCRLLTGFLDAAVMYVTVKFLGWPDMYMKVISNGIVIVLNYVASRWIIFKNK